MIKYPVVASRLLKTSKDGFFMVEHFNAKGVSCAIRKVKNGCVVCRDFIGEESKSKAVSKQIIKDMKVGLLSGEFIGEYPAKDKNVS